MGQPAGGVVHGFNDLLQNVGGGLALIERHRGDAEAVSDAARMTAKAVERGAAVTRRLLAFICRREPERGAVDVVALLEEMGELLAHTLAAGTEVHLAVERDLPPLLADKGQSVTVLVNPALNARDAMPRSGDSHSAPPPRMSRRRGKGPGAWCRVPASNSG